MRDYGKVSPQFWVGKTGRELRGNVEAQLVALYLMTSPHANMIGVFYCPIDYIAKETGLPFEGASKGLLALIEGGFCTYESDFEYVFVHQFAANQIGDELKPNDKRVQGVINELAKVPKGQCYQSFRANYAVPFNLPLETKKPSPLEGPSKPHRSQKQKQEQKQNTYAPPEGVADSVWQDFQKLRKAKRAPITDTALDGIRIEAQKAGLSLGDALAMCCKRGWQGFDATWLNGSHPPGRPAKLVGEDWTRGAT